MWFVNIIICYCDVMNLLNDCFQLNYEIILKRKGFV